MAHKNVYICDKCQSYITDSQFKVTIKIDSPTYVSAGKPTTTNVVTGANRMIEREVCKACATKLFEDLSLELSDAEMTKRVFADFALTPLDKPAT